MEIRESTKEERGWVDDQLVEFNRRSVPFLQAKDFIPVSFVATEPTGQVLAGINAWLYCWQVLTVDILFVTETHRSKGYGSMLLKKVETRAVELGAYMAHLDTFDWQAKAFYEKHGYEVFGVLEDCPRGHRRFFLKKVF